LIRPTPLPLRHAANQELTGFSKFQTRPSCSTSSTIDVAAADRRLLRRSVPSARDLRVYVDSDCRCRSMYNVRCRDASLRYVSYARSVALYRRPLFRCWWSHWYIPDWIMGKACWSAVRPTWCANSSRCAT